MPNMYHAFDARLEHRAPASAAVTATATVDTIEQRAAMRTTFLTRINLEAIKITANDEVYSFIVQLSNDDFTTIETAAMVSVGATEVRHGGAKDSVAGDLLELLWSTEQAGEVFQDARLRLVIAGTSPSVTFAAHSTIMPGA